jgi:hypothetical protein
MEDKLIIALIAFTGILLGLLANSTSYFWLSREQKSKNKKAILFQLLEVRHLLKAKSVNPNILYRKYIEYCELYFSNKGVDGSELPDELKYLIQVHFKELSEAFCKDTSLDELNKSLNKSILELSENFPIMAFKISGIDSAKMVFKTQQNYSDKFIVLVQQEKNQDILESVIKQLDDAYQIALDVIFGDINEKITNVAEACGKADLKAANKIMSNNPTINFDFEELGLNDFLDELLLQVSNNEQALVSA